MRSTSSARTSASRSGRPSSCSPPPKLSGCRSRCTPNSSPTWAVRSWRRVFAALSCDHLEFAERGGSNGARARRQRWQCSCRLRTTAWPSRASPRSPRCARPGPGWRSRATVIRAQHRAPSLLLALSMATRLFGLTAEEALSWALRARRRARWDLLRRARHAQRRATGRGLRGVERKALTGGTVVLDWL